MKKAPSPVGPARSQTKTQPILGQSELAALGLLEPCLLSFDTDLPEYRSIKSAVRGLACWRIPVALGRHRFDQILAVHRLLGFLEDAGRRIQGTELLGFDRHRRRTGLLDSGLLGGFLGAAGPGAFLLFND